MLTLLAIHCNSRGRESVPCPGLRIVNFVYFVRPQGRKVATLPPPPGAPAARSCPQTSLMVPNPNSCFLTAVIVIPRLEEEEWPGLTLQDKNPTQPQTNPKDPPILELGIETHQTLSKPHQSLSSLKHPGKLGVQRGTKKSYISPACRSVLCFLLC